MGAIPKPDIDYLFWNRYFVLEMADFMITQTKCRCDLNVGPSLKEIGLKAIFREEENDTK